jgi:integrase
MITSSHACSASRELLPTEADNPSHTVLSRRTTHIETSQRPWEAGTPQYTAKSFRRFFVSEAIHANIPLFEVATWVGHRSTRTTELVYGHLVRRAMGRGARSMDNRLGLKPAPCKGRIVPPSLAPAEGDTEGWGDVA